MSTNLENKKQLVEEIKEKLESAKSVVFVDYKGLNVAEANKLRRDFKESNSEYKVYKNKLLLRALNDLGISGVDAHLSGTTSVAFGYEDEVAPAKIIVEAIKNTKKMSVKFGLLDGQVVSEDNVKSLSQLPTKEVLVAQLLSVLNGPATSLARVLNAPTQGLALALNAIAEKE
jgi:large subunit ribosomal protein L10